MSEPAVASVRAHLEGARWFGGKGRDFDVVTMRRAGVLGGEQPDPPAGPVVTIELLTLAYADGPREQETYQVPLAHYAEPQERLSRALVGTWEDPTLAPGPRHAYDALHDPDATALLLAAFESRRQDPPLAFHRLPGHALDLGARSRLFSGEQSNSSLMFGTQALLKVFRKVVPGQNPDVAIHRALTERGSDDVAALYGWLELEPEGGADGPEESMHLAMLQELLSDARDGWALALDSVRAADGVDGSGIDGSGIDGSGGDATGFAAEAEALGAATAEVHAVLAEEFPTESWAATDLDGVADAMQARLEQAAVVVPELRPLADELHAVFAGVTALEGEATAQRVHGDYHLGQTLRTGAGWRIVDFEGEPAKTLAERVRPDLPWRDVAGMLRSFDYAAHAAHAGTAATGADGAGGAGAAASTAWAESHQAAFLRGYTARSPLTPDGSLSTAQEHVLAAYVADKAVYEAVYEARNRPTWLPIPLGAVARLTRHEASVPASEENTA